MATPTPAVSVAAQNLQDAAFRRLSQAVLRRRTLTLFTTAISRDAKAADPDLAKPSNRVLQYMRGYIQAVELELVAAQEAYDQEAYKSVRRTRVKIRTSEAAT